MSIELNEKQKEILKKELKRLFSDNKKNRLTYQDEYGRGYTDGVHDGMLDILNLFEGLNLKISYIN